MLFHRIYRNEQVRDWVVFVHGAGGSSVVWFKQIRAFRPWFNILMVDLRGHGRSAAYGGNGSPYSLEGISSDILDVMDHHRIIDAHFVGVSLGTVLIRTLQERHPTRVRSAVYAGAVVGFTAPARLLIAAGHSLKYIVPFQALYAVFAWIIMPGRKAQEARRVFRREARSVRPAEFRRWLRLTREVHSKLAARSTLARSSPTLYVMGARDYLFLAPARRAVETDPSAVLNVVERAGHVCNIEQPALFNRIAIAFLRR